MELTPIGYIRCEFPEKFGVPKQPNLVPELRAKLCLEGDCAHETSVRGLEDCSHLWVIFQFHLSQKFSGTTVRPPVLGGEKRVGVFATRSPHRPNPIGLSLVKLERVAFENGLIVLEVLGHDFVDGTPILDIKPYIASYDSPSSPSFHWSDQSPRKSLAVTWTSSALEQLSTLKKLEHKKLIEDVLKLDPRPRSAKANDQFGMSFVDLNIGFSAKGETIIIGEVSATSPIKK